MGSDDITATLFGVSGKFQSTLPGWGATVVTMPVTDVDWISIHAPRMGSDCGIAAGC